MSRRDEFGACSDARCGRGVIPPHEGRDSSSQIIRRQNTSVSFMITDMNSVMSEAARVYNLNIHQELHKSEQKSSEDHSDGLLRDLLQKVSHPHHHIELYNRAPETLALRSLTPLDSLQLTRITLKENLILDIVKEPFTWVNTPLFVHLFQPGNFEETGVVSHGTEDSQTHTSLLCYSEKRKMLCSRRVLQQWIFALFLLCSPVPHHGRPVDALSSRILEIVPRGVLIVCAHLCVCSEFEVWAAPQMPPRCSAGHLLLAQTCFCAAPLRDGRPLIESEREGSLIPSQTTSPSGGDYSAHALSCLCKTRMRVPGPPRPHISV
ncbi:hypothetical protein E1301_Tti011633 [Triplophysa tibetana]|uniref:Uncharacterized protein n=1 Tax=Triplophysa tibetana TaxID=1572043 RepID=A0A5A9PDV9_9TELE|nr:hypothetical protein E1301_Tti011633 [Triplophysa tibetana]